ncbi:hypothetical protein FBZ92_13477 [Nitrospirillum viridazoti]|uniref:Uncharacterized protein n=1 Tax=Nitrospirillum amazonense TaxID=28077 RepID=A0A560HM32_9PROT|nr:hypothetical protein FBZ92_13477 [Nitrospirillum amazonense]
MRTNTIQAVMSDVPVVVACRLVTPAPPLQASERVFNLMGPPAPPPFALAFPPPPPHDGEQL